MYVLKQLKLKVNQNISLLIFLNTKKGIVSLLKYTNLIIQTLMRYFLEQMIVLAIVIVSVFQALHLNVYIVIK